MDLDLYIQNLLTLKTEMESIAGQWDGHEPGIFEERADMADGIIATVDELISQINELNEPLPF
jgi:hypothetical protein